MLKILVINSIMFLIFVQFLIFSSFEDEGPKTEVELTRTDALDYYRKMQVFSGNLRTNIYDKFITIIVVFFDNSCTRSGQPKALPGEKYPRVLSSLHRTRGVRGGARCVAGPRRCSHYWISMVSILNI
jgi:hypothetical protein